MTSKSPEISSHHPVIAEATSSADDVTMIHLDESPDISNNFIADDDDEIAIHVELSSDGMPTNQQWYNHEQEHDYLKNTTEMEPESSGMDEVEALGEIVDNTGDIELIENDNAQGFNIEPVTRISNYDTELPQEIFNKAEQQPSSHLNTSYAHRADPVVVVGQSAQYNQVILSQEDASGSPQYNEFTMEETDIEVVAGTNNEVHNNFQGKLTK